MASPPCAPNAMSVFSRSPTMIVRAGSKSCLCISAQRRRPRAGRKRTHFARMQSSIVRAGLPIATGERPSAHASGATIAPAPGSRPAAVTSAVCLCGATTLGGARTSGRGVRAVLVRGDERAAGDAGEVLERLRVLGVRDGHVEPADDGADVRVEREVRERERARLVVRRVLAGACRRVIVARGKGVGRTVPPRVWMPSSASSASSPSWPITYTFLSLGSLRIEETYTAAANAEPKISSWARGQRSRTRVMELEREMAHDAGLDA